MKICAECKFSKKEFVQVAPGQVAPVLFCLQEECRDPVEGTPLPCGNARGNAAFCSLQAKYFEQKPDDAVPAPTPAEGSLIQVAK